MNSSGELKRFLHLSKEPNVKKNKKMQVFLFGMTDSLMGNVYRPVTKTNKGPLLDL